MSSTIREEPLDLPGASTNVPPLSTQHSALSTRNSLRAWCYLVWLSWQRQARARQMVLIALGLLGLATALVALGTSQRTWYLPGFQRRLDEVLMTLGALRSAGQGFAPPDLFVGIARALVGTDATALLMFSQLVVFSVLVSFLLPMWTLSFATEGLGGEREAGSLIWLLTRPLSRPGIFLAKFVALLPWTVGLNVGGFALLCLAGGRPGALAFRLFWPAVLWATLAFSALFYLMGAWFRRPAVVAILYSFFLEIVVGNLPGYLKRVSIGFYARCLMFEAAEGYGIEPEKPSVYLPVEGDTALTVLVALTVGLLVVGMVVFAWKQYHETVQ
jgi:ABC-2 type transport system permease protein